LIPYDTYTRNQESHTANNGSLFCKRHNLQADILPLTYSAYTITTFKGVSTHTT